MSFNKKNPPSEITLEAKIDENNKVLGIKAHVSLDAGAYIGLSGVVLSRAMLAVTNAYTINNLDVSGDVYVTNTVPTGAFRGFGSPQMIFAIEMFMNHLAKDLGLDPYQFRLNHLVKQGDLTSTSGLYRDPIILKDMIGKAMAISDYQKKTEEYAKLDSFKGIGMSWFFTRMWLYWRWRKCALKAKVRIVKDEKDVVHLHIAAVDMGQGARTSLKRVVAMALGVENEQVVF
jgi:CO/xanthine dehydrogenase Mo-binding subunit